MVVFLFVEIIKLITKVVDDGVGNLVDLDPREVAVNGHSGRWSRLLGRHGHLLEFCGFDIFGEQCSQSVNFWRESPNSKTQTSAHHGENAP